MALWLTVSCAGPRLGCIGIDRNSAIAHLTAPGVTLELYVAAMRALKGAYRGIDFLFLRSRDLYPPGVLPYIPRVPGIDRELSALGGLSDDTSGDRRDEKLSAPESEAAYLGMRHVVEGEQIGSRLVYRHLQETFGEEPVVFGSFWVPDSLVQSSWPGVLTALSRLE
jgi:heme oxygenase